MGIFEAVIGLPALKAVSRLIRELLRTRTGPGDRDLVAPAIGRSPPIDSAGDQPVTPTAARRHRWCRPTRCCTKRSRSRAEVDRCAALLKEIGAKIVRGPRWTAPGRPVTTMCCSRTRTASGWRSILCLALVLWAEGAHFDPGSGVRRRVSRIPNLLQHGRDRLCLRAGLVYRSEQPFCRFEVGCLKPLGEPIVDGGQDFTRRSGTILVAPQSS
jgi:hypothetical protein